MHMTCTRTCTHARARAHVHTCTHAHTCTRAHTHTRTCHVYPRRSRPPATARARSSRSTRRGAALSECPPWQHPLGSTPARLPSGTRLSRACSGRAGRLWPARHSQEEAGPLSAPPLHFSLYDGLAAYDPSGGARTTGCSRGQTGSSPCETLTRCASTRLPTAFSAESTSLITATLKNIYRLTGRRSNGSGRLLLTAPSCST